MDSICKILVFGILIFMLVQLNDASANENTNLSDELVVQMDGGLKKAAEYANKHGLELIGQVGHSFSFCFLHVSLYSFGYFQKGGKSLWLLSIQIGQS